MHLLVTHIREWTCPSSMRSNLVGMGDDEKRASRDDQYSYTTLEFMMHSDPTWSSIFNRTRLTSRSS